MFEPAAMNDAFTLAQLSDPHLSSLTGVRVRDLLSKRALGYMSWRLHRRAEHRGEVLAALLRDLRCTRLDHIVVTGDLTHLGLPSEFREARQWLDSLGPPSQVTVVPGNHDAYVTTSWDHTFALWAPYMVSDAMPFRTATEPDSLATFPSVRVRGRIAFIGLSTARPSAPFFAVGSVGPEQLRRLEQVLVETGRQQMFRILLLHHPPVAGTVTWRKRLTDSLAFRSVVARHGAELVLHGHAHRTSLGHLETPAGMVPAIGVPSASVIGRSRGRPAQYHVYRLLRNADGWELLVSVRGYTPAEERFIAEGETRLVLRRPLAAQASS